MVLDEVDQLDSKNQDVLYTMFKLPALEDSRLVLIGMFDLVLRLSLTRVPIGTGYLSVTTLFLRLRK